MAQARGSASNTLLRGSTSIDSGEESEDEVRAPRVSAAPEGSQCKQQTVARGELGGRSKSKRERSLSPERGGCCDGDSEGAQSDGDREMADRQSTKRVKMNAGEIGAAAIAQWGLDEAKVAAWAAQKRLPGIGFADVLQYRREHPEEDLTAGFTDLCD